jgi:hypothetical protein
MSTIDPKFMKVYQQWENKLLEYEENIKCDHQIPRNTRRDWFDHFDDLRILFKKTLTIRAGVTYHKYDENVVIYLMHMVLFTNPSEEPGFKKENTSDIEKKKMYELFINNYFSQYQKLIENSGLYNRRKENLPENQCLNNNRNFFKLYEGTDNLDIFFLNIFKTSKRIDLNPDNPTSNEEKAKKMHKWLETVGGFNYYSYGHRLRTALFEYFNKKLVSNNIESFKTISSLPPLLQSIQNTNMQNTSNSVNNKLQELINLANSLANHYAILKTILLQFGQTQNKQQRKNRVKGVIKGVQRVINSRNFPLPFNMTGKITA